jgi:hypothetical protein
MMADPHCPHCHGTGVAGGHWLGDRWCDHEHTWHFCPCSEVRAALGVGEPAEGNGG